jgi:hypothetical protein
VIDLACLCDGPALGDDWLRTHIPDEDREICRVVLKVLRLTSGFIKGFADRFERGDTVSPLWQPAMRRISTRDDTVWYLDLPVFGASWLSTGAL